MGGRWDILRALQGIVVLQRLLRCRYIFYKGFNVLSIEIRLSSSWMKEKDDHANPSKIDVKRGIRAIGFACAKATGFDNSLAVHLESKWHEAFRGIQTQHGDQGVDFPPPAPTNYAPSNDLMDFFPSNPLAAVDGTIAAGSI